jgi:hypothetical protein
MGERGRGTSSTPHAELGCEALQESLILEKLSHSLLQPRLPHLLHLGVLEEHAPQPINLIFNTLRMLYNLKRVLEVRFLFGCVFMVGAVVVGNLHEPYGGADEDV